MKTSGIPLSTASKHREGDSKAGEFVLSQCGIGRSPDGKRKRFVAVLYWTCVNHLGHGGNTWRAPVHSLNQVGIRFNSLGVCSHPMGDPDGNQVDMLLCHLELLEIGWNVSRDIWNTHLHNFKLLTMRIKSLVVISPQMQN